MRVVRSTQTPEEIDRALRLCTETILITGTRQYPDDTLLQALLGNFRIYVANDPSGAVAYSERALASATVRAAAVCILSCSRQQSAPVSCSLRFFDLFALSVCFCFARRHLPRCRWRSFSSWSSLPVPVARTRAAARAPWTSLGEHISRFNHSACIRWDPSPTELITFCCAAFPSTFLSYVEFQHVFAEVLKHHRSAYRSERSFWRLCALARVAFRDLSEALNAIADRQERAERAYKEALEKYPRVRGLT